MRSVVLVGQGSHRRGEAAQATYLYAEQLRARGEFTEVLEAFWKEEPSLRQVLKTASSTDVTVIPLLMSEGYLTGTVIPRELGLGHQGPVPAEGVARTLGGRTVRYTRPCGAHPEMAGVLLARAREACPDLGEDTALVLLGPARRGARVGSAPAAPPSTLEAQASALRNLGVVAEVHTRQLDDLVAATGQAGEAWLEGILAPRVVVVPFFGSETAATRAAVRQALGLPAEDGEEPGEATPGAQAGGRAVYYARSAGTHPGVVDVLLALARGAMGEPGTPGGDVDPGHARVWGALHERAAAGLRLGELLITPVSGMYELRHALDEGKPGGDLLTLVTPEGLRDVTSRDEGGKHRPVRTHRSLPRGWRAVLHPPELRAGLHAVYPAVVEETAAHAAHALRATPWATTARRQTGLYARVQRATPEQVEAVAADVCAPCLRTRLWAGERLPHTFLSGVPGGLPCAEACTYLIAAVHDVVAGPTRLTRAEPGQGS